jgi:hypothetical protein
MLKHPAHQFALDDEAQQIHTQQASEYLSADKPFRESESNGFGSPSRTFSGNRAEPIDLNARSH